MSSKYKYTVTIYYTHGFCCDWGSCDSFRGAFDFVREILARNTIDSRTLDKIQVFEVNECNCIVREWVFRFLDEFTFALEGGEK